ncbi:MAG TPA: hypothetical protein VJB57_19290 [Dehalococcoidia bacterium]|nr:hypothetical protein [Dehalococcoidia bacterium]
MAAKPMNAEPTAQVTLYLPYALKLSLKEQAHKAGLSLSAYIVSRVSAAKP